MADQASTAVTLGEETAGVVSVTMKGFDASSRMITHINSSIYGVAFQTDILALNAAFEGAHAGEQR
jgi:methyl-accepting chemotaxis protein